MTEQEAVAAALAAHRKEAAKTYIEELIWRGYFKEWLERRPQVWDSYVQGLQVDLLSLKRDWQMHRDVDLATSSQTGIACFDASMQELVETGYLHNHARMWFASIWIFTLGLPWRLGTDFFCRHLLAGGVASIIQGLGACFSFWKRSTRSICGTVNAAIPINTICKIDCSGTAASAFCNIVKPISPPKTVIAVNNPAVRSACLWFSSDANALVKCRTVCRLQK